MLKFRKGAMRMSDRATPEDGLIIREYEYKAPLFVIFLLFFIFGFITFLAIHEALNNTQGLIIKRRFSTLAELSSDQATVFYWFIALVSLAFFLLGVGLAVSRFSQRHSIIITVNGITMPKSILLPTPVTIPFSEITDLQVMTVNGARSLIVMVGSKKYTIAAGCLPRQQDFDEILFLLAEAVKRF